MYICCYTYDYLELLYCFQSARYILGDDSKDNNKEQRCSRRRRKLFGITQYIDHAMGIDFIIKIVS